MYGRTEHRYNLRRIGDVTRELEAHREILASVRVDITQDDPKGTADACLQLREAQVQLGIALNRLDKAVALLPTPVA